MVQLVTSNAKLEATLRRTPPFDLGIDPFEGQLRDILLRTEEASVRRDDRNDEATKEVVQRGKEAMLLDHCSNPRGEMRQESAAADPVLPPAGSSSLLHANHSPLYGFWRLVDTALERAAAELSNAVSTTAWKPPQWLVLDMQR